MQRSSMLSKAVPEERYQTSTAIILWFGWLFGFAGLHRFYLGKPVSGIIYLLTWGLFGFGQVFDLLRLRRMVNDENLKLVGREALALQRAGYHPVHPNQRQLPAGPPQPQRSPEEIMRQQLMQAAAQHGGRISVSQGVMATGKDFAEVEKMLDAMAHSGYVGIDNDPDSGVLVYTFGEL